MRKLEIAAWMLECPTMGGDTGWILSWSRSGAGLCNRISGKEHEKPLYTHEALITLAEAVRDAIHEYNGIDISQVDLQNIIEQLENN